MLYRSTSIEIIIKFSPSLPIHAIAAGSSARARGFRSSSSIETFINSKVQDIVQPPPPASHPSHRSPPYRMARTLLSRGNLDE